MEEAASKVFACAFPFDCLSLSTGAFFFVDAGLVGASLRTRFDSCADTPSLAAFSVNVPATARFVGCEAAGCVVVRRRFEAEGDRLRDRDWAC